MEFGNPQCIANRLNFSGHKNIQNLTLLTELAPSILLGSFERTSNCHGHPYKKK
jgi:hypothetical protein